MKLEKFGVITEQPDGRLCFSAFTLDCEGESWPDAEEAVLTAVIGRMQNELHELKVKRLAGQS